MAAIYAVYTSPTHPPIPNHLPTLIVTPHGQPSNILYSYLHTNFNSENYLLTPSPQGDLCVAKLFPPRQIPGKSTASDPGHSSSSAARLVRCEASRNLKWSIANTGVISPIYKLSLPSPDSPDLPLFQISKPNPNAAFWSMFYFAYAGHNIPPKRIEFGKIQKNPPGPNGGGTRISITGKTPEEKAVWQTLGEGNEDCVEWVVLCAALNLLDDEIMKAAEKNPPTPAAPGPMPNGAPGPMPNGTPGPGGRPAPVALHDPGPASAPSQGQPRPGPSQQHPPRGPPPPHAQGGPGPGPGGRPPQGFPPPRGFAPGQGPPPGSMPPGPGQGGYPPGFGPGRHPPPQQHRMPGPPGGPPPGMLPGRAPPPQQPHPQQIPPGQQQQAMPRRF
ncbi:hypothetical protein DEU56DRAFT_764331 [Suillus clintonianus]|uniref:uncharacterized protein n=1 Tax=Suillus clintonianus TaxID=1904413 RepID=UPI001B878F9C|nr:uncharacterized protein DEU56DRAFT_764331 [Suillus clintonianus]KAG2157380.1 hypothetical protein DEU56DRAFT_764331 [Suillus clintonianus]